jgi:hypothetical protein
VVKSRTSDQTELRGGRRGVIDAGEVHDLAADALDAEMGDAVAVALDGDARFANSFLPAFGAVGGDRPL